MYTLYYLTKNLALNCMKVDSLDVCIPIPEDLIFVACRSGINFIKEPAEKLSFTDVERLIMSTEFYDTNFIKDEDFRKANTQMCPVDSSVDPTSSSLLFRETLIFYQGEHDGFFEISGIEPYQVFKCYISESNDLDDFIYLSDLNFEFRQGNKIYYHFLPLNAKRLYINNSMGFSLLVNVPPIQDWVQPIG